MRHHEADLDDVYYESAEDDEEPSYCNFPVNEPMHEEDWQSLFEEQLLDIYDELMRLHRVGGWPIFDRLTYAKFAEFAWKASSKYPTVK